jgi:hypothetical protein
MSCARHARVLLIPQSSMSGFRPLRLFCNSSWIDRFKLNDQSLSRRHRSQLLKLALIWRVYFHSGISSGHAPLLLVRSHADHLVQILTMSCLHYCRRLRLKWLPASSRLHHWSPSLTSPRRVPQDHGVLAPRLGRRPTRFPQSGIGGPKLYTFLVVPVLVVVMAVGFAPFAGRALQLRQLNPLHRVHMPRCHQDGRKQGPPNKFSPMYARLLIYLLPNPCW